MSTAEAAGEGHSGLFSERAGSGSATLVFLHGFAGCHELWSSIAAAFSRTHTTIAYDLPGHGRSLGFPGAGKARAAALSILAELTAHGIAKAHFVGHSMGGAVATLAALNEPARVASLTLLAPGGFGPEINGALLWRYGAAISPEEIRNCLATMSGPGSSVDEAAVAALAAMRARPGQAEMLVRIAADISRNDRQGAIPPELLRGLEMPVRVLWGTEDPLLPYRQTGSLPPQFELQTVEGAGHMLAEEVPDQVVDAIRQTLG